MTFKRAALFIAQGFGIGRAPFAPGTFGTALGFAWFLALTATGNSAFFITAMLLGIFVSILVSEIGEEVLGAKDPGSIVIDEVIAIPICFLGWLAAAGLPSPQYFLTEGRWKCSLAILIAFRVFDIWKPSPIRSLQKLPGGWGVTADDVLAGIYVVALSFLAIIVTR